MSPVCRFGRTKYVSKQFKSGGFDGVIISGEWYVLDWGLGERLGFLSPEDFRRFLARHWDVIEEQGGRLHPLHDGADRGSYALNLVAASLAAKIAETASSAAVESELFYASMAANTAIEAAAAKDPVLEMAILRAEAHERLSRDLIALRDRLGPSDVLDRELVAQEKLTRRHRRDVLGAICDAKLLERIDINTSQHELAIAAASLPAYVLLRVFADPDRGVEPLRERIERHVGHTVTTAEIEQILNDHRQAGYLEDRNQGLKPRSSFRERARRNEALEADAQSVKAILDPLPRDQPVDPVATAGAVFGERPDPLLAYVAANQYASERRIYYILHGQFRRFNDPVAASMSRTRSTRWK